MRSMRLAARILLIVFGVLLVLTGIDMAFTSDAELWWPPVIVGACIAVPGAILTSAGSSFAARR